MRIQSLSAKNFRGFKDIKIDAFAYNLTVFVGTNGQGKSSLLDLMAIHLNQFVRYMDRLNRGIMNSNRFLGESLLTHKDINNNAQILDTKIQLLSGIKTQFKNQETLFKDDEIFNILHISRDANIQSSAKLNEGDTLIKKDFVQFCRSFYEVVESHNTMSIPIMVYYQANRTVYGDISIREKVPRYIGISQLNVYESAFTKRQNDFDDFFLWFKHEEDKENEAIRREQNFEYRNIQLEIVRLSIIQFFTFLSSDIYRNLRVERNDNGTNQGLRYKYPRSSSASLLINKNNETLSIDQLSDGEKNIILLVCDIGRRLAIANPTTDKNINNILETGSGIVLIDEIDLHLHPKWQKDVLKALVKTFQSIQFIVTTHSPYVITHLDFKEAEAQTQVYAIANDAIVPIQSKGKDLSTASFEIFGVERRPQLYQNLIDDLFREFERDNPNMELLDKKFKELKGLLGETDPEVESAKIILEGLKL